MEVVYTRHAKNRMRERNISKDEVERTLQEPEHKENLTANRSNYFHRFGSRHLRVTFVIENGKHIIISAVDKSD